MCRQITIVEAVLHQGLGLEKVDLVELIDLLDWWIYCFRFAKILEDASKKIGP